MEKEEIFYKHFSDAESEENYLELLTKQSLKEEILSAMEEYASHPSRQSEIELPSDEEVYKAARNYSSHREDAIVFTAACKWLRDKIKSQLSSHPSPERFDIPDRSDNELKQMLTRKHKTESREVERIPLKKRVLSILNDLIINHEADAIPLDNESIKEIRQLHKLISSK